MMRADKPNEHARPKTARCHRAGRPHPIPPVDYLQFEVFLDFGEHPLGPAELAVLRVGGDELR